MKGYKLQLFLLILSFLDEIIISIIALGIPFVYVIPRIKVAICEFYVKRIALHDEEVKQIAREAKKSTKSMQYRQGGERYSSLLIYT